MTLVCYNWTKKDINHAGILKDFVFSEIDIYPFSRRLEATINKLQLSRSIMVEYTRPRKIRMTAQARARELALLAQNSPESMPVLEKLGAEFRKVCEQFPA